MPEIECSGKDLEDGFYLPFNASPRGKSGPYRSFTTVQLHSCFSYLLRLFKACPVQVSRYVHFQDLTSPKTAKHDSGFFKCIEVIARGPLTSVLPSLRCQQYLRDYTDTYISGLSYRAICKRKIEVAWVSLGRNPTGLEQSRNVGNLQHH